jgi:hypothetical protein
MKHQQITPATVGKDGPAKERFALAPRPLTVEEAMILDPPRLLRLAAELDAAGAACKAMADRTIKPTSKVRHLARASACYGSANLLRKIAR